MVLLTIGCSGTDSVQSLENVPTTRPQGTVSFQNLDSGHAGSGNEPAATPSRMVVGIFERPEATWFFKIVGPPQDVTAAEEQWKPFLEAIQFDSEGRPTWEIPDGWKKTGGETQFRFATLSIGSHSPPLELVISSLASGQDLLMNVNRWLGQLGKPAIEKDDVDSYLVKQTTTIGPMLLFDQTGQFNGGMAPFARGGGASGPAKSADAAGPPAPNITYETPADWKSGSTSAMTRVRLTKAADGLEVEISVNRLPPTVNDWPMLAKMWAGQVGIGDLTDEKVAQSTEEIEIDSNPGKQISVESQTDADKPKSIMAVMVERDDATWFFKLSGDRDMVKTEAETFQEFIRSVRFE